ncbi:MAG: hypothetical protein M2R45_00139 [Verrucomicrobia subdivision 3 bacterium]|nr:hypothetical protein [Limisphaerales bacterium]MCS1412401.1 hypothetical protein [Limisphaerales bacterium]
MKKLSTICAVAVIVGLCARGSAANSAENQPVIQSIHSTGTDIIVSASIPRGYRSVVLRSGGSVQLPLDHILVAGRLNGNESQVTFTIPDPGELTFLCLEADLSSDVPDAEFVGDDYFHLEESPSGSNELTPDEMVDHLLNRITYGPSFSERQLVESIGIDAYIERQLNPIMETEAANNRLSELESRLFEDFQPFSDTKLIAAGEEWQYFRGVEEPPEDWRILDFDAMHWESGPSGIGYGDGDDETVLEDMRRTDDQPGYLSVFLRKRFQVPDPRVLNQIVFTARYDDGFVAYLNGKEIGRANMNGTFPRFDAEATGTVDQYPEVFDEVLGKADDVLVPGWNVLAIQLHNTNPTSSDASMVPELVDHRSLTDEVFTRIRGIDELQQLVYVRGGFARNQLQTILAEFWENHFTTDFDKVAEYFKDLRNSDGERAMDDDQAAWEAAQVECKEYQFFHDRALGNFGDLLLFSATSPSQLIYLDNVLNKAGEPNENYAREILELFAFGADNRYTQEDIEQLSKCFTGWQVRKVQHDRQLSYPDSARKPPTAASVGFVENVLLDIGPGWKYFKGVWEPSPKRGSPTTRWTEVDFDDSEWLDGATSIGYGDGDDATVLNDMRARGNQKGYTSVYLRRKFTIDAPSVEGLFLSIEYDDGYVAYLNGVEFARSENMASRGTPPRYNRTASANHEVTSGRSYVSLSEVQDILRPSPEVNVLSIQVHNVEPTSSDLSVHPRIVERMNASGSIENGDPSGFWTFRFNPEDHDRDRKVLFEGTPHEMVIPAGREGIKGLRDALDVIDAMVNHPSSAEFITLKLINRFVSDEITLESYHDRRASESLLRLMDDAIEAWFSTMPVGNIKTVMQTILDPNRPGNAFWSREVYRTKVKTPLEYINSMFRALDWKINPEDLPEMSEGMGMHLFTRDDPDGWSEYGFDWVSTGGLLERINFVKRLVDFNGDQYLDDWDVGDFLRSHNLESAEDIVDYFDRLLVNGKMSANTRQILLEFSSTDSRGRTVPFARNRGDYERRAGELIGFILAMPECHYQ